MAQITSVPDKQDQRKLIARMKATAARLTGAEVVHDRQRRTKVLPEVNHYSLVRDGKPVLVLNTATGTATWKPGL